MFMSMCACVCVRVYVYVYVYVCMCVLCMCVCLCVCSRFVRSQRVEYYTLTIEDSLHLLIVCLIVCYDPCRLFD